MAKQVVDVGNKANDGSGDSLREAGIKINENFTEIYSALGGTSGSLSAVSKLTGANGLIVSNPTGDITLTNRIATTSQLGVIKVGTNLSINSEGVLSANAGTYTLPTATGSVLGGVKVGSGLSISNGVLSTTVQNNTSLVNGAYTAQINADGSITLPTLTTINWEDTTLTGPTLQMGNDPSVSEVVITGPAPDNTYFDARRLIIQGQQGYGGENNSKGEGGDVYIWAGSGADAGAIDPRGDGGDVKLRGGFGGNNGGYIRLESGDAEAENGTGGFLDLNAGNANNTNGYGGNVNIRAGTGVQQSGTVNITSGGTWTFDSQGRLRIPNGYALISAQNTYIVNGAPPAVVYNSEDGTVGAVKATIKVFCQQAAVDGDYDEDIQVCEMLISVRGRYQNSVWTKSAVASVYGVTHTSTLPLATFTVNFIQNYQVYPGITRDVVQILAEPTAAMTGSNMWVMVAATEMTND